MINNHENNEKNIYEVWALGYDKEGQPTDIELFLGTFDNPSEAIEHAKKFYDLECITGKPDHPDFEDLCLEDGAYLEVRVEKCIEHGEPEEEFDPEEGWTECFDILYEATLYAEDKK